MMKGASAIGFAWVQNMPLPQHSHHQRAREVQDAAFASDYGRWPCFTMQSLNMAVLWF